MWHKVADLATFSEVSPLAAALDCLLAELMWLSGLLRLRWLAAGSEGSAGSTPPAAGSDFRSPSVRMRGVA